MISHIRTTSILLTRAAQFAPAMIISALQGDIKAAFDHMCPDLIAAALDDWGQHPIAIAALLREAQDLEATLGFAEALEGPLVVRFKSSWPQGGTDSPFLWDACTSYLIAPLVSRWQQKG